MADVSEVEVVIAHQERATLRVGDLFLKVDADPDRTRLELEAMTLAPVPTAEVLWHRPSVLALAAVRGAPLARLGEPSSASSAAWAAAGTVVRRLHETPPPPWPSRREADPAGELDRECAWLVDHDVLPADLVHGNRAIALSALRPAPQVFVHGDLHVAHVFVDGDEVTAVLDWSEAGQGDAAYDLASLTLGHRDRLDDVLTGYGGEVDVDAVRGWWSLRSLLAIRWLIEHGFDPHLPGCEVDVLRAQLRERPGA